MGPHGQYRIEQQDALFSPPVEVTGRRNGRTDVGRYLLKDILQRQLADDDEYRALIQKKIAAEIALKALIGEEAWSLYLELDAISNELESVRQEAMYLAGAADHEKLSK